MRTAVYKVDVACDRAGAKTHSLFMYAGNKIKQ